MYRRYTKISSDKKWIVTTTDEVSQKSKIMDNMLACAQNSSSDKDRRAKILKALEEEYGGSWKVKKIFLVLCLICLRLILEN